MITVSEYNIDVGHKRFTKLLLEWPDHINKFDSVHTMQHLMKEDGYPIMHQRIAPGIPMVANRSLYHCVYHGKEGEELIPLAGPIP